MSTIEIIYHLIQLLVEFTAATSLIRDAMH